MSKTSLPEAFIVGTAGHIDHGKSTLVRALTGVDPDRLPEEKRRGITIALGFATLSLPSGRVASFVDVPGHERLVRTMVAGATGMDAVLLCVSAVEGVMPQTREHLDILGLLGVRRGLVVLTMADLVDEELAELAEEDARSTVAGTFLEGAPILRTSATTGAGLPELVKELDKLPVQARDSAGPFRLPVDRSFVRRGFGTVVTGTVASGQVQDGDELIILPQGERTRVRGVQVHGQARSGSRAGYRTALNLAGVEKDELPRGTVVASPKGVPLSSILDVRYHHLPSAPKLKRSERVRLLIGTAEVMASLHAIEGEVEPGAHPLLQLRTAEPVVALQGDRFVLRRESPVITLGGGVVIDPMAPKARPRDAARIAGELRRLEAKEPLAWLERAGAAGLSVAEASERPGGLPAEAVRLGDRVFTPAIAAQLRDQLLASLHAFHAENPLLPGAPRRALLRGELGSLDGATFDALLDALAAEGALIAEGPRARLSGWSVQRSPEDIASEALIRGRLEAAGLIAPETAELLEGVSRGELLLSLMMEEGTVLRIGGRYHDRRVVERMADQVRAQLAAEGELSPGRFKDLTGLTRKHAIPLLEWLDSQKITRRQGEVRVAR